MQANGGHVRKRAEQERDDRAAHDRHNQQTGAIAGERASSAMPRVKILGNMMELKKPTRMMLAMAMWPLVSIEVSTRALAQNAAMPKTVPALTFCRIAEPMKRPIMAPPQ